MFKIRSFISKLRILLLLKYNYLLNKIAVNSNVYKELYDKVSLNKSTYDHLEEIYSTINNSPSIKLLNTIIRNGKLSSLSLTDEKVAKSSELGDLIICKGSTIRIGKILSGYAQTGEVKSISEIDKLNRLDRYPGAIYVSPNIWTKDLLELNNLLIKIRTNMMKGF